MDTRKEQTTAISSNNPKKSKLRMPYERNFAQVCIISIVVFCTLFSLEIFSMTLRTFMDVS